MEINIIEINGKGVQELTYDIDRAIDNERIIKDSAARFILENMRESGIIAIRQLDIEEFAGDPLDLGKGRTLDIIEIFGCATLPEICYTDKDETANWESIKEYSLGLESLKSVLAWFQKIMDALKEGKLICQDGTLAPNLVKVER